MSDPGASDGRVGGRQDQKREQQDRQMMEHRVAERIARLRRYLAETEVAAVLNEVPIVVERRH